MNVNPEILARKYVEEVEAIETRELVNQGYADNFALLFKDGFQEVCDAVRRVQFYTFLGTSDFGDYVAEQFADTKAGIGVRVVSILEIEYRDEDGWFRDCLPRFEPYITEITLNGISDVLDNPRAYGDAVINLLREVVIPNKLSILLLPGHPHELQMEFGKSIPS